MLKIDQKVAEGEDNAASYCGLRDKKYPDRRSMGYPFDRLARKGVDTLEEFMTPNMAMQNITIRFNDGMGRKLQEGSR